MRYPARSRFSVLFRAAFAAGVVAAAPAQAGSLVMGAYPDKIMIVDDATGVVKQRVQLAAGLPTSLRLSNDGKKIYITTITTGGIVVMDAASKKVLSTFDLDTPGTKYRFNGGAPDPQGRFFYTVATKIDKLNDRYVVSKPMYLAIDLTQKKIVRSVEVAPEDDTLNAGYRTQYMVSQDGKLLYLFRDKVAILDTADFKEVGRIDLAKPQGIDLENGSFGAPSETLRNGAEYVGLFNASDPLIHAKQFGIGRFNLAARTFDFQPIGPAPYTMDGLEVSPDGKNGYTVTTQGTLGSKRCEFWHFDLTTNQMVGNTEFPCRTRFTFGMSADGKKLYIYGASFDIEVYDAATLKKETTWNLEADATMAGMVQVP
jgi:hypothetical protein